MLFYEIFCDYQKTFNVCILLTFSADWMQGKWLAVELRDDIAQYNVFNNIKELCENYKNVDSILIDVPIGLPENAEQAKNRPNQSARDYLKVKDRKSSIFNVPFRQMVYVEKNLNFGNLTNI